MKISLTRQDERELDQLFTMLETNIQNAHYVLNFVQSHARTIKPHSLIKIDLPEEKAYEIMMRRKLNIKSAPFPICRVSIIEAKKYENNPYYKTISLHQIRDVAWHLEPVTYKPYEAFIADDVMVNERKYFQEIYQVGICKEPFTYLNLAQDNITWMSITPNEIETMQKAIETVTGKVITFGLGLGYFAFMAALKPTVSSVTIVEKDPKIIALFKEHILPQFPHQEKIHIIENDAFIYLQETMAQESYDYAFVDIWRTVDDGFPLYLRFRSLEKKASSCKFLYWIEEAMLVMLRRYVISLIREATEGWQAKDYDNPKTETDLIFQKLYQLLRDVEMNTYRDIMNILKKDYLKTLAAQIL